MTILNIWCEADRAVVAVDTNVYLHGVGHAGEAEKSAVFHGAQLVVASRGPIKAFNVLIKEIERSAVGFDRLAFVLRSRMPSILSRAFSIGIEGADCWVIAIVGWSEKSHRFAAQVFASNRTQCTSAPSKNPVLMPPVHAAELEASPFSRDAMEGVMKRQLEAAWGDPQIKGGYGGRMIYTVISKSGIKSESVALPEPPLPHAPINQCGADSSDAA